jgi:hypothetical protein
MRNHISFKLFSLYFQASLIRISSCGLSALVGAGGSNIVYDNSQVFVIMTKSETINDTHQHMCPGFDPKRRQERVRLFSTTTEIGECHQHYKGSGNRVCHLR